jgi:CBS domain containing-hemolysin-like protein
LEQIDIPLRWVGIVVALLIIGLAAAAEASLSMISRRQLHSLQTSSRATLVHALIDDAYRFKVSLLLLNTIALIAVTTLTAGLVADLSIWLQLAWLGGLTVVIILFAEALPKAIALRNPSGTARLITGPFYFLTVVLRPVIIVIDFIARRLFGISGANDLTPIVTEEELLTIVNVGEEEGVIEPNEREMIEDIITFGDTIVREIMIPRVDVITIIASASFQEAIMLITSHGHSRVPVIKESSDRIIGILYAKDILAHMRYGQPHQTISGLMRQPYYVPEMIKIDMLLRNMQTKRVHFAVVVDEYGATTGIVTLEDILEEIVGEIHDEFDPTSVPDVVWNGAGDVVVDARMLLDDVNDLTGLDLSSESSDRIGGFVAEKLGRMSEAGDIVKLSEQTQLTVIAIEGLRSSRIRITFVPNNQGARNDTNQSATTD